MKFSKLIINNIIGIFDAISISASVFGLTQCSKPNPPPPVALNLLSPESPDWATYFGNQTSDTMNGFEGGVGGTGDIAFANSSYDGIDFSDFGSIGERAFVDCQSLSSGTKSFTISFENFVSTSDTSISYAAFWGCARITNIILPKATTETNTFSIGDSAFARCMGLTEVSLPDNGSASKISIGDNAFDDCFNLEYFSLPNANISIGTDVFDDCVNLKALKSTTDLTKIISIGNAAFEKCSSLTIDGIRKLENKIDTNNLKYVGDENGAAIVAALDKTWLNRAGIVSGDLTNLFVEKGYFNGSMVTGAFANCDSLTGIDLQDANLPTLGTGAFDDATVLNSVKLPNNTTSIPMATFAHCSGLTNLYWYGSSAPSVETQAFLECAHNGKLHITLSYALSQDISEGQTVSNWAELDSYGWTYTIDNI